MSEEKLTGVHCRGCGRPLDNPRRIFHPDCLKRDKARRVAKKRARERERLFRCPRCRKKCPCETSHGGAVQLLGAGTQ
jgi:hypothetical protein